MEDCMKDTHGTLTRMSETDDYEVASSERDVRGWTVITADGEPVGRVTDLIVDPAQMKVRYIEAAPSSSGTAEQSGGVLVPVEAADLDDDSRSVIIHGMTLTQIAALPRYGTRFEQTSAASYERPSRQDDTRRLTRAEEELRIGKRAVQTGEVRVGKHVETEHVSTPVNLAKERVTVERRPVTEATTGEVRIGDTGEIVVPIVEEQAVVEKRAVVKEEIVIAKERVEETETVEAEVRKEQFDVDSTAATTATRGGR
jgi:uncharacterized protein (TIGR02271 family)